MRAVYLEGFEGREGQKVVLTDDIHKHLSKVVRVKKAEAIRILNGDGFSMSSEILEISKKETTLLIGKVENMPDERKFHLVVGQTKKEALEEVLRKSVELGVRSLTFLESEYAQNKTLKPERVTSILESSYCQSNNPWKLQVTHSLPFSELKEMIGSFTGACFMSVEKTSSPTRVQRDCLLIVGPEGGFSASEERQLKDWGAESLHLETPILRAPTAAVAGLGFLHGACR